MLSWAWLEKKRKGYPSFQKLKSKSISQRKTARRDCVSWPVDVSLNVLHLVQLVPQLGSELDPKCDKMTYLTGIQWWWSQVSGTQIETTFSVRMLWRSGRAPQLLEMKKTIQPPGTNIYSYSDLAWRGIILETVGKDPESHLNTTGAIFTVLLNKKVMFNGMNVSGTLSWHPAHTLPHLLRSKALQQSLWD